MGFRSTFTMEHYAIEWPDWFREKWKFLIQFNRDGGSLFHPRREFKFITELIDDIAKSLEESGWWNGGINFVIVFLHECGGITRVQFDKGRVRYSEPEDWKHVDHPTHSYCYDCSDVENIGWKERQANRKPRTPYDSETCRPYIDPTTGESTERKK